jgi:hypothetical protein
LTTQLALVVDCDAAALGNYCTDDLRVFWPEEIISPRTQASFQQLLRNSQIVELWCKRTAGSEMEVCSHVVQRRLACTQVLFLLLAPAIFLQLQFIGPSCVEAQSLVSGNASWALLLENAGIACMHMAVTYMGPVIFLDRTDIGPSQIALPNGRCRNDSQDQTDTYDCTAHSVMFDPATNTVRPLYIATDTWCSSGQFLPNGTMLQTGGYNDGVQKIRSAGGCIFFHL